MELASDPSDPAQIRYRPVQLPPDLAVRLLLHKPDILALLQWDGLFDDSSAGVEADYIMHERLGVADELEMPTHTGSPAWLVAVGEGLKNSGCICASSMLYSGDDKSHRRNTERNQDKRTDAISNRQGIRGVPIPSFTSDTR